MKWVDTEDIADSLEKAHPEQDIFALRFTELKSMIVGLSEFDDNADGCNEKILEAIQMAWSERRDG
ncbi:Fe-S cluster assembly protein IscX [Anaplasma capra]|uniref:Fe-S cluster assembly protein IscX n=1 Tax=Anaplasma capra TaxID=1562740 RepID=UPI0021D58274|nr:Fe-S cluster assembly protein IscX [Anaplasma capra]MCU7611359.1 Fe-S cluster assembly protein IscX [Anaplasma capra]